MAVGATRQLTATVAPSDADQNVTWSTSSAATATVNASGLVTAVANGTATITATSTVDGTIKGTATVTVTTPVSGVTISPKTASIEVGATRQLTPTVAPSGASNKAVTYKSSDTSVATVSGSGLVTGVKAGTATITVTTTDGSKTDTSAITVTDPA